MSASLLEQISGGIELRVDPDVAATKGLAQMDMRKHPMTRPLCFHDAEDLELFKVAVKRWAGGDR